MTHQDTTTEDDSDVDSIVSRVRAAVVEDGLGVEEAIDRHLGILDTPMDSEDILQEYAQRYAGAGGVHLVCRDCDHEGLHYSRGRARFEAGVHREETATSDGQAHQVDVAEVY